MIFKNAGTKIKRMTSASLITLSLIVVFYLGIFNIAVPSVWLDEATTALFARQDTYGHVIKTTFENKPYPPLYYLVVHESLKIRDDEFGLRLPSAASGTLTVLFVFLLGRSMFGTAVGILAALLTFLSPKLFFQMRDGTSYAFFCMLTTASTYFLWQAHSQKKRAAWVLFIAGAILSLATHMLAIFFLIALTAGYLCLLEPPGNATPKSPGDQFRAVLRSGRPFWISLVAISVPYSLWLTYFFMHSTQTGNASPGTVFGPGLIPMMWNNYQSYALTPSMQGLQIAGIAACLSWDKRKTAFLFLTASIYFLLTLLFLRFVNPSGSTKFVLNSAPFLYLFAAASLKIPTLIARKFPKIKAVPWCLAGCLSLVLYQELAFNSAALRLRLLQPGFEAWREMAQILTEKGEPGDAIFISAEFMKKPLEYYYKGPLPRVEIRRDQTDPMNTTALLEKNLPGKNRAWLILSHLDGSELKSNFSKFNWSLKTREGKTLRITLVEIAKGTLPSIEFSLYELQTPLAPP